MNFYQAQDNARKQSRLLVALFSIAVVLLVVLTNICVALFVLYSNPEYSLSASGDIRFQQHDFISWCIRLFEVLGWQKGLWTSVLVVGIILIAMLFKWSELKQGGRRVAESLGGTLILTETRHIHEKQLLNVVEEIAIASGMPVPPVYLLKNEAGINAFAAGLSHEDAVIGITQGALQSFNREQLQGVIAHEFSHILNGDMRLNMTLVAVLHGILMIAESGRFFMRLGSSSHEGKSKWSHNLGSGNRNRNGNVGGLFILFGLCLWLLGSIGQLFGALIKAAVSRQREFLADASAVQFTRNANGIAEALQLIGGSAFQSRVDHHGAHELGHLFFSNASGLDKGWILFHPSRWSWFATHPPLDDRIKRVLPSWRGDFLAPDNSNCAQLNTDPDPAYPSFSQMQAKSDQNSVVEQNQNKLIDPLQQNSKPLFEFEVLNPPSLGGEAFTINNGIKHLHKLVHQPFDASMFLFCLFFDDGKKDEQLKYLERSYLAKGVNIKNSIKGIHVFLDELNTKERLETLEIAMPALKMLSKQQYQQIKQHLMILIKLDGQVSLHEWLWYQLVTQNLDSHFGLGKAIKTRYKNIDVLKAPLEVVLSRVIYFGFENLKMKEFDQQDVRLAFLRAAYILGVQRAKLKEFDECDGAYFSRALYQLRLAYPLLKPRILKAILAAIHFDGVVTDSERHVVKAIAAVMDCPLIGLEIEG